MKAALAKMETAEVEGCRGAGGEMIRIKGQLIGDVCLNGTSHIMVQSFLVVEELVVTMIWEWIS